MSTAQATVDDTVAITRPSHAREETADSTVLAVIAVAQLIWFAALVYGAFSLLT
jgi:hypothetical protein